MKILFLADNFPPETNAAATRVYERAVYWATWGHEVTVITSFPNFPQGHLHAGYRNLWRSAESRDGIRVVRVKTFIAANKGGAFLRALDFLSFLVTGTLAALAERRPDVVVATSPQFFAAVAGWLVGALRDVPFVFELGDIWPASIVGVGAMRGNPLLGLMEKLELFLYRRSAKVVALTRAFRDNLIRRGIDPSKIAVVRNGVDLGRYAPRPRDAALAEEWKLAGKFVVGYVGTHGMAHGLGNVLDAAAIIRGREDICFLLVGDGAEREALVADAARRGLANVRLIGPQPKEAMPRVWSLVDVALVHLRDSPVFAEVIPSKIFEATAMGKPILLAAPAGEAKEIVEADGAGVWVAPGDAAQLASAARGLADDAARRERLADAALRAAPLHSRRAQAEDMIRVLQAVAGR
jgi:glycosyltransferase involved in cell wall biosynthesis